MRNENAVQPTKGAMINHRKLVIALGASPARIFTSIFLLVAFALPGGRASADGKFFSDRIPPEIPYQRAILSYDGDKEELIIESKLEAQEGNRFGWVVPVPAVPEIGTRDALRMDMAYSLLEKETKAVEVTTIKVADLLVLVFLIGWFSYQFLLGIKRVKPKGHLVGILAILGVLAAYVWPIESGLVGAGILLIMEVLIGGYCFRIDRAVGRGKPAGHLFVIIFLLSVVILAIVLPPYGIEVLKQERVGPYEAKVIRGASSIELIDWLTKNGFAFDERDRTAIDGYIARKWVFVTAKLDAGATRAQGKMVPPLFLSFKSKEAVYPLALTGTGGRPTEVLLYVFAGNRMDDGGRLPLQFAGKTLKGFSGEFMTKFRGRLDPDQMRTDLILKPAASNASYRKWEFRP